MGVASSSLLTQLSIYLICICVGLIGIGLVLILKRAIWRGVFSVAAGVMVGAIQAAASSRHWLQGSAIVDVPYTTTIERLFLTFVAQIAAAGTLLLLYRGFRSPARLRLGAAVAVTLLVPSTLLLSMRTISSHSGTVYVGEQSIPIPQLDSDETPLIELPDGYQARLLLSDGIGHPTALCFGPGDRLFVSDVEGSVWVTSFAQDGSLAPPELVIADLQTALGIAWYGDELYVSSAGRIDAFSLNAQAGIVSSRTVVDDLPALIYVFHQNNQIVFGPDGRLYVGVGSTSDGLPETNPLAASILSMNPDGSDLRVFATGLRNAYGLAFDAADNLWATDNGPASFDPTPPDELNLIRAGGDYGFPETYDDDSRPAEHTVMPVTTFPPHSAPTGIAIYPGNDFPDGLREDLFVGAWNHGDIYRVRLSIVDDEVVHATSLFASGFANPAALAVDSLGRLLVADFGYQSIYAIEVSER